MHNGIIIVCISLQKIGGQFKFKYVFKDTKYRYTSISTQKVDIGIKL